MDTEPAWVARKAELESYDDGNGPYMEWWWVEPDVVHERKKAWDDFVVWAKDNLGQGFSLACCEGACLDQVTSWCFKGFKAGRGLTD